MRRLVRIRPIPSDFRIFFGNSHQAIGGFNTAAELQSCWEKVHRFGRVTGLQRWEPVTWRWRTQVGRQIQKAFQLLNNSVPPPSRTTG